MIANYMHSNVEQFLLSDNDDSSQFTMMIRQMTRFQRIIL